ncbi:MAG TPA: hypothetical protein VN310_18030 [Candidatus Dormibacteraeota bacterium]|nr:hypothetical protein [Candidatus Dormibacteraeota bacterium]
MQPRSILQHFVLFNIAVLLLASTYASAQAGTLDVTFANKGIFTAPTSKSTANAVAIQSDGKIVVAGLGVFNNAFADMLFRLNTNGTLDTSFGSGGTANIAGFGFFGLAIQSNGDIVTASEGQGSFQVARFKSNGTLDTSFGADGLTAPIVVGGQGVLTSGSLALQSDGKILVVEGSGNPSLMVRYTSSGQLDTSFGIDGLVNLQYASPTQVTLQSDGKILVASGASGILGFTLNPLSAPTAQAGELTRYNSNGTIDNSFGAAGTAASVASASALLLQTDGKIVVAGAITSKRNAPLTASDVGFGIMRYNSNGSLDRTFGNGGVAVTDLGATATDSGPYALAIQSNGDIVAGGIAGITTASVFTAAFGLTRYTSAGALDTTFGTGGIVLTQPTTESNPVSLVSALSIQSDGKIVAIGNAAFDFVFENGFVARYLSQ